MKLSDRIALVGLVAVTAACGGENGVSMSIELFASKGALPGLSVRIQDDLGEREFSLDDFRENETGRWETPRFEVAETGDAAISVTLIEEGDTVVSGGTSIELRPDYLWSLHLFRQSGDPTDGCFGCLGHASIAIDEAFRATSEERVWVVWGGQEMGSDVMY